MTERRMLDELAEFIAEGVDVDWDAARSACTDDQRAILGRLELLDRMRRALEDEDKAGPEPCKERSRWGHLLILDRLGQGATAVVYRAQDPTLNREVALKLRVAGSKRGEGSASWIREARRLARVRHPNVLAVHGADVHDGVPGLWCERVDGTTLGARSRESPPDDAEALDGAEALLSAVCAVHRAGLVHGDIKPDNVMYDSDGRLILMDFGAAARYEGVQSVDDRAGTPLAMSPERFARASLTPAVDVFGVGIVLYHWLEGRYPVLGSSAASIRDQWARGVRIRFRRRTGPRALRRLVRRMLAPDPNERPTAGDALAMVRSIRAAPVRRLRFGSALAVIGGLALALGIALTALQTSRQAQRETAAVSGFLSDVLSASRRIRLGPGVSMASMLEDSARLAPTQLADQPAALADVLTTIGGSLRRLEQFDEARAVLDRAAELHVSLDRPVAAARTRKARADLARELREFDAADALYRQNLDTLQPGPGRTPIRVDSWLGLGQTALARSDLDTADTVFERAMTEARAVLGDDAEQVFQVQMAQGQLALQRGRYQAALEPLRAAMAYYLDRSGPRNRNVLVARQSLLEALDRLDRLDEAARLAEENAAVAVEWLGPTDRFTVMALDGVANLEMRRGRPQAALEASREALAGLLSQADPPAEMVLHLESNQVAYLLDLGRPDEALRLAERVLPRLIDTLELGHPVVYVTSLNLADALLAVGRSVEALAMARDLHRRYAAQFGDRHLFTLVAAYLAGGALDRVGEPEAARGFLEAAHAGLVEQLGEGNPLSLKAARLLGDHWLRVGQYGRASALIEPAYNASLDALGPEHVRTRNLDALRQQVAAAIGGEY